MRIFPLWLRPVCRSPCRARPTAAVESSISSQIEADTFLEIPTNRVLSSRFEGAARYFNNDRLEAYDLGSD